MTQTSTAPVRIARRMPAAQRLGATPSIIGSYQPGTSIVHRSPVWLKILLVLGAGLCVGFFRSPLVSTVTFIAAVGWFTMSGSRWRTIAKMWPLLIALTPITAYHLITGNSSLAYAVPLGIAACVLFATTTTATTPLTTIITLLTQSTRRLIGEHAALVVGLTIALTLRTIPLLLELFAATRQALHARHVRATPLRLILPVVLRATGHALSTGDALEARGVLHDRPTRGE